MPFFLERSALQTLSPTSAMLNEAPGRKHWSRDVSFPPKVSMMTKFTRHVTYYLFLNTINVKNHIINVKYLVKCVMYATIAIYILFIMRYFLDTS